MINMNLLIFTCNGLSQGRRSFFARGGKILKKGHFFVEKALPTKANFGSHAAI